MYYYYVYFWFSLPFVAISTFFWYFDLRTSYFQHRYQKPSRQLLSEKYRDIVPCVAFNLFVVQPLMTFIGGQIVLVHENAFSISEFAISLVVCTIVYEFLFTGLHLLLHKNKFLYKHIHSFHHKLKISVAVGGLYVDPLEYVVIGPIFWILCLDIATRVVTHFLQVDVHVYTVCALSAISSSSIALFHSGYFGEHIRHHFHVTTDYSPFGMLDFLMKTRSRKPLVLRCAEGSYAL